MGIFILKRSKRARFLRHDNATKDESRVMFLPEHASVGLVGSAACSFASADPGDAASNREDSAAPNSKRRKRRVCVSPDSATTRFGGGDATCSGTHHSDTEGGASAEVSVARFFVFEFVFFEEAKALPFGKKAIRGEDNPNAFSAASSRRFFCPPRFKEPETVRGAATKNSTRRNHETATRACSKLGGASLGAES
jgi:hypothetical protein